MRVLGFGALNVDFIYEVEDLGFLKCKEFNLEPGREVVLDENCLRKFSDKITRFGILKKVCPGGSAANTCYMLSLLGIPTCLIGVLGKDREGDYYAKWLDSESRKMVIRRGRTGISYILNEKSKSGGESDRAIAVVPNSNSELKKEDIDMDRVSMCSWIHMSSFLSESAIEAQMYVKESLIGKKGLSIDPGEIYASLGKKILNLIEGMDILFCSERELCLLFGSDIDSSLRSALGLVKMIVLKKGKEGASLYLKGESYNIKAEKVRAVDTTGAGDVLDGVFLGFLLLGYDPQYALKKAVCAASESVKGYGRDSYPKNLLFGTKDD